jgi:RNA polymerase sigma-70 factor (ECF subfamily)
MMQERPDRPPVDTGFDSLYRREISSLRTLAAALTGSREMGADLAHEAMLRTFRDWERVSTLDRPGAWVRKVVLNLATDAHRRRVRELRAMERLSARVDAAPSEPADGAFWRAVRALPELQRHAAALFYVDDLSVDHIADVLGVAPGTVKKALFQARGNLARTLGDETEER